MKKLLFLLLIVCSSTSSFATKYRYLTTPFSVSGATTVCSSGGTTPITVSFTSAGTCGSGSAAESDFTITWYYNTTNSTTIAGATLVSGPTATNTATLNYTYNAPLNVVATRYYFCVITYSTPANVTACNGGLTSISSSNTVQVTVNALPTTANAGTDQNLSACASTTTLAGNTPASGTGTWTCVSGCTGVSITSPTSPTSSISGLSASTTTVMRWTTTLGSCSTSDDVSINVPSCLNETCADAITVSCGNTYTGTTVGASDVGETSLPICGYSPAAPGVWYRFVGDGSTVTAALCGSSYDTKINVYSGASCGSISSCVASDDDGCGTSSTVTFTTSVGTNYYILVNGYSGATGSFSLAITCCTPGVPTCATLNSPANGATGIAQCSSLSWTAPVMGGCGSVDSYDVYFGTTNPPPFYSNTTSTSLPVACTPSTTYYWQIRPKNGSGAATGCTIRSFTSASGGNPQYTMVDDANSPSPYNCVNLTTTTNDQRGCAWDVNSTLNFASDFSFDFTVNLGSSDAGADGMAFVMQNDPQGRCKCGLQGGSLGAGGIANSVVVEIDTYINYEDRDDFSSSFIGCSGSEDPDHLDIWFNGNINPDTDGNCNATGTGERPAVSSAVRLQNGGSNYNIENGQNHILRISWSAGSSTLTARILNTALTTTYGTISSTFNPLTVFGTNTPYFGFTASTGGLNNAQSFCNPAQLLPVELMSFNAYCYDQFRKIYWSTASENNNAYFTLEKSTNGIDFEVLETFPAMGYKVGNTNYEFTDLELGFSTDYYRLSQTDHNGVTKYFDIIASNCNKNQNGLFFNEIVINQQRIDVHFNAETDENHQLILYDESGRIIQKDELDVSKGANFIQLNKTNLSSGMYLISLISSSGKISKKIVLN